VLVYNSYKILIISTVTAQEIDYGMLDDEFELLNRVVANLEWQALKNRSIVPLEVYTQIVQFKLKWKNEWCAKLTNLRDNKVSVNQKLLRFLCKGPKYTDEMARYDEEPGN